MPLVVLANPVSAIATIAVARTGTRLVPLAYAVTAPAAVDLTTPRFVVLTHPVPAVALDAIRRAGAAL